MQFSREDIRRNALEVGRRYRISKALPKGLLREPVYCAWERSHLSGADPLRPRAESLSPVETERLIERHSALVAAAQPYMQMLSRAAGNERTQRC
jgi:sigma-54 dependent transcriptional regulator, acetoin dehydrogenase operon transcriptional activator AcoR